MTAAVFAFADDADRAGDLARHCGVPLHRIESRRFPDGESLVRVTATAQTALLYRSLDNPDAKLVELLLAASALRDGGARRVILIAPYLAYMRQDMAFHPGEAVSQKVIGGLLAATFDGVVTVDPHLHRVASLAEAIPGIPAIALSAAPALAAAIGAGPSGPDTVLVGPDSESRPWVEAIARPLGLEVLVGEKVRKGDRDVALDIPGIAAVRGRRAVLIDDLISSGTTLIGCAAMLRNAGAQEIAAFATHCLACAEDVVRLRNAGIARILATDSTGHELARIPLAGILSQAIAAQGWLAPSVKEDPSA